MRAKESGMSERIGFAVIIEGDFLLEKEKNEDLFNCLHLNGPFHLTQRIKIFSTIEQAEKCVIEHVTRNCHLIVELSYGAGELILKKVFEKGSH